jgi:hypothetical protein
MKIISRESPEVMTENQKIALIVRSTLTVPNKTGMSSREIIKNGCFLARRTDCRWKTQREVTVRLQICGRLDGVRELAEFCGLFTA